MVLRIPPALKTWWAENWRRAATLASLTVLMASLLAFERYQKSLTEFPAGPDASEAEAVEPAPTASLQPTPRAGAPAVPDAPPPTAPPPAQSAAAKSPPPPSVAAVPGEEPARPHLGPVQRPFGWGLSPTYKDYRLHPGVDFEGAAGSRVTAALSGRVISAGAADEGLTVLIDHGSGKKTLYAGLGEILVRPGERVTRGQPIGRVGASMVSEISQPPHLHFELIEGEEAADPGFR